MTLSLLIPLQNESGQYTGNNNIPGRGVEIGDPGSGLAVLSCFMVGMGFIAGMVHQPFL